MEKLLSLATDCRIGPLFFSLYNVVKVVLLWRPLPWWNKPKWWVTVLRAYKYDGSDKLRTVVMGKYTSSHSCKNIKISSTIYDGNTNLWTASRIFEDYLTRLDRKMGAKDRKILLSLIRVLLN